MSKEALRDWIDEAKRLTHRLVHNAKLESAYAGGPLAAKYRGETQAAQSLLFMHFESALSLLRAELEAGGEAHPMVDGCTSSVLASSDKGHRIVIHYETRAQADAAHEWLAASPVAADTKGDAK